MQAAGADPIATERLILRRPAPTDVDAIFDIHGDPETNRFNPVGPMRSREDAEARLATWRAHWERHGFGYWAVAAKDAPARIIGFGGIVRRELQDRSCLNLYFRFRPEAWGRGFAGEVADAALHLAFEKLGENNVIATTRPDNEPSIRALMRAGLVRTGEIEDAIGASLVFAVTAAEYRARMQGQTPRHIRAPLR